MCPVSLFPLNLHILWGLIEYADTRRDIARIISIQLDIFRFRLGTTIFLKYLSKGDFLTIGVENLPRLGINIVCILNNSQIMSQETPL